jgi:hypothetical protein
MHGGPSTEPRTPEGKARCAAANWKHGRRSKAAIQRRREARATLRMVRELLSTSSGNTQASGSFRLSTPTTAQIIEAASGGSITSVILNTLGWIDRRGKDI